MKINAGQAPSTLIPEYIGSDFDKVITVADNLNDIKTVSTNINDVVAVGDNILDVNTVAADVEDVTLVADNIGYVKDVAEGIEGLPVSGYIGDTPPTQPKVGATWYCTLDGRNYTWYEDVDSGQWVESSPQSTADDPHLAGNIFTLWKRSAAEAGYNLVTGSFEEGGVLTSSTDVLWHKGLDSIYSWTGSFPKTVTPGTDPTLTGSGYVPRMDVVLRGQLASSEGAGLVGTANGLTVADSADDWVYPERYFIAGDIDETMSIQRALDANKCVKLRKGKTYLVSPQALVNPEGGSGICINMQSGYHLKLNRATIKLRDGQGGFGAVISNTSAIDDVSVVGPGIVDSNRSTLAPGVIMSGVLFFDATNTSIEKVTSKSPAWIGLGIRNIANAPTTPVPSNNRIKSCNVYDSGFIGIQCRRPYNGVEIVGNSVSYCVDNAIDIEGNNTSGLGYGQQIIITGNVTAYTSSGIFLESVGGAIVTGNDVSQFTIAGLVINRINSGSLDNLVTSNKFHDASSSLCGILSNNSSGDTLIASNRFSDLVNSIECRGYATGLSIGKNQHKNISEMLIKIPKDDGALHMSKSRIEAQDYIGTYSSGKPFTCSPISNPNNIPARAFNVSLDTAYYLENGGKRGATQRDEYKNGWSRTMASNPAWGDAYSLYFKGETLVYFAAGGPPAGDYLEINGVLYYIQETNGAETTLRDYNKVAGDYTAALNSGYSCVGYYKEWQES